MTLHRRRHPLIAYWTVNLQMRIWINSYAHPKKRFYDTIKGSAQATQAALLYTTAQCNPTAEGGPDRKPKIKPLLKEKAEDKTTQTQEKDNSK